MAWAMPWGAQAGSPVGISEEKANLQGARRGPRAPNIPEGPTPGMPFITTVCPSCPVPMIHTDTGGESTA